MKLKDKKKERLVNKIIDDYGFDIDYIIDVNIKTLEDI